MVLIVLICGSVTPTGALTDPHAIIQRMGSAYNGIHDYTALFLKRIRVKGKLLPLEKIELRFQEPFKVYMAWREPHKGRVITYVEGENDDKMLVNPGGMFRFMRLSLDPTSPMITRNSHHTILQVGLLNMIELLMQHYRTGIQENQAALHFRGHGDVDGRPAYRLGLVCHTEKNIGCYGARGEIWIDKAHYLPTRVHIYDGDDRLYEHYEYQRLQLNPGLGPEAFRLTSAAKGQVPTAVAEENRFP